jgi:LuxR family transcriptional regulator, maltose regulon positive regulatory protein
MGDGSRRPTSARLFTLNPPPVPPASLVHRSRLTSALDKSTQTPLTLVVAPAGAGKTALVSGWAVTRQRDPAGTDVRWVASHEQAKLFGQVLLAAGVPLAAVRRLTDRAKAVDTAQAHAEAIALLRGAAASHAPDVLVVDDAQQLPAETLRFLYRVLETTPEAVRLVLLSRRDLLLPVVLLQLSNSVTVLRAAQLRFTDPEAKQLVASHAPTASKDDINELQTHTQGWAAALILGARTLDRSRDVEASRLLLRTTETPVLDYLLGELFESLPDKSRELLLATCQEPMLTASDASVLSGLPDAADHLAELARDGLLVTAYQDAEAEGGLLWRYHPLLLELLRRRTGPTGPDWQALVDAHVRAVTYYDERGDALNAVRHATLCGDPEVLASVLLQHGPTLLAAARPDVVHEGFARLPESVRREHRELLGLEGVLKWVAGDIPGAVKAAAEASEALGNLSSVDGDRTADTIALDADVALLGVWQAGLGWADPRRAISEGERVLGCQHSDPEESHHAASNLPLVRNAWLMLETAAAEAWNGDLASASVHVQEALLTARTIQHDSLVAAGLAHRSMMELLDGAVQTAADTARACLESSAAAGVEHNPYTSRAHLVLCWAAFQRLDVELARTELAIVQGAPVSAIDPFVVVLEALLRTRLLAEQGRVEDGIRALAGRLIVPQPVPAFMLRLVAVVHAQLAALMGDAAEIRVQADRLVELGYPADAAFFEAIALAYRGEPAKALGDLDKLLEDRTSTGTIRAGASVVRLVLLLRTGAVDGARAFLPEVLSLVAPQQLLHVLTTGLAAGTAFTDLLYEEVQRQGGHPYASEALAAMSRYKSPYPYFIGRDDSPLAGSRVAPAANPGGPESGNGHPTRAQPRATGDGGTVPLVTLTPRESEVLHQLSLGGSYGDIARALYVTENTVKTHLTSIYRKFGVDRRAEALHVARELGLVATPDPEPTR